MSEVWRTSAGMWRSFIDADAVMVVAGRPPLDELDATVLQTLGAAGFLGGLEETTVSAVVDADGAPAPGANGAASESGEFDSMTTMVRATSPAEELETVATTAPEPPPAQPSAPPQSEAVPAAVAENAAAHTVPLEVAVEVPEQELEVELAPTSTPGGSEVDGLYIPALTKADDEPPPVAPAGPAPAGPQIETERVTPAESTHDAVAPRSHGAPEAPVYSEPPAQAAVAPETEPPVQPARTGGTLPPIDSDPPAAPAAPPAASGGTLIPRSPEPVPQAPVPAAPVPAAPVPAAPAAAIVATPGRAASGGTLVAEHGSAPVIATPGPAASGGTLVPATPSADVQTTSSGTLVPSEPPPSAVTVGGTVVGPAPTAPERPPPPPAADATPSSQTVSPDQSAASSQTAGEIVSRFDAAAESTTAGQIYDEEEDDLHPSASSSGSKVVIAVAAEDDAEEVDADDILEADAPAPAPAEPPVAVEPQAAAAPTPAPPSPPPPPPPPPKPHHRHPPPPPPPPPPAPPSPPPPTPRKAKAKDGKPPPAPPQAPAAARSETESALAGLAAERGGGTAANLERAAERAEKTGAWYESAFGEHYAALGRPNHARLAKAEVDFFVQASGLNPGARVLDVGCGDGAHSLVLAQRGFAVTGFDNSLPQLLRATQANEALAAGAIFVHGDMRDPPVEGTFDGIVCMGSTLGYFDEADNRNVFRKLREHLAPGGKMLIQLFNRDHVIGRLPTRSWWQGHGCQVLDEVQMNYFTNRLKIKRAIVFEDGRQFEHQISIRAYTAHELGAICVEHGLRVLEISGSRLTRGRFYGATSPEIWLVVSPK